MTGFGSMARSTLSTRRAITHCLSMASAPVARSAASDLISSIRRMTSTSHSKLHRDNAQDRGSRHHPPIVTMSMLHTSSPNQLDRHKTCDAVRLGRMDRWIDDAPAAHRQRLITNLTQLCEERQYYDFKILYDPSQAPLPCDSNAECADELAGGPRGPRAATILLALADAERAPSAAKSRPVAGGPGGRYCLTTPVCAASARNAAAMSALV